MYSMNRTSAPTLRPYSSRAIDLVVVHAADDHGVELQCRESRAAAASMPASTASSRRCVSATGSGRGCSVSRLTVRRWRPAARSACAWREQHAVGREREVGDAPRAAERFDQDRQIAPEQRLAAGDADPVDAERRERVDESAISSNVSRLSRGSQT